jgi:glutamine amidotransferase
MVGGEDSADSILIASEPLTSDLSSWIEVPEYGLLAANMSAQRPEISTTDIRL